MAVPKKKLPQKKSKRMPTIDDHDEEAMAPMKGKKKKPMPKGKK
jgi:hypothetical protein